MATLLCVSCLKISVSPYQHISRFFPTAKVKYAMAVITPH